MKKWKVFSAAVLSAAMLAAPMTAMADDAYRVCFVARASADTFAAWLTNEMKKAAEIWRRQPNVMERTSKYRFRTNDSVNQWLVSAWDMVSGRFCPTNEKRLGRCLTLDERNLEDVCDAVRRQKWQLICLNDKGTTKDPARCFAEAAKAFEAILPDRSSFEK